MEVGQRGAWEESYGHGTARAKVLRQEMVRPPVQNAAPTVSDWTGPPSARASRSLPPLGPCVLVAHPDSAPGSSLHPTLIPAARRVL